MYRLSVLNSSPQAYYPLQNGYHPLRRSATGALANGFVDTNRPINFKMDRAIVSTEYRAFGIEFWLLPLWNVATKTIVSNGDTSVSLVGPDTLVFKCGNVIISATVPRKSSHIFLRFTGEMVNIFVDGRIVSSADFAGSFSSYDGFTLTSPFNNLAISDLAFYKSLVDSNTVEQHYAAGVDPRAEASYSSLNHIKLETPEFDIDDTVVWPGQGNQEYNNMYFDGESLTAQEDTIWRGSYTWSNDVVIQSASLEVDATAIVEYSLDGENWLIATHQAFGVVDSTEILLRSSLLVNQRINKIVLKTYVETESKVRGTENTIDFGPVIVKGSAVPLSHTQHSGLQLFSDPKLKIVDQPSSMNVMVYLANHDNQPILTTVGGGTNVAITNKVATGITAANVNGGRGLLPGWNLFTLLNPGSDVTIHSDAINYVSLSYTAVNDYKRLFIWSNLSISDQGPTVSPTPRPNLYSIPWSMV